MAKAALFEKEKEDSNVTLFAVVLHCVKNITSDPYRLLSLFFASLAGCGPRGVYVDDCK